MFVETYLTNRTVPTPASQLTRCGNSRCKSEDIFTFDDEVFCQACDWNSIEAHVEAQMRCHSENWKKLKAQTLPPKTEAQSTAAQNGINTSTQEKSTPDLPLASPVLFSESLEVTQPPMTA
jgi:hypothetical protein